MNCLLNDFRIFEFDGFWYIDDYWFDVVDRVVFGVEDIGFYYVI